MVADQPALPVTRFDMADFADRATGDMRRASCRAATLRYVRLTMPTRPAASLASVISRARA
jgi:hypothetical protein